jgi:branched-chain amino acid transport system permease protein
VPAPPQFIQDWFGIRLSNDEWIYFLALFIAFIMMLLALNIVRSRVGRAFVAIRDSEIAAQAMGISVPRYKTIAFGISAFYGGVAGGTYAQVVGYVSPESFNFLLSINFLTTIVIGGLASILGSVLGATGLIVVPELPGLVSFIPGANLPDELSWAFYGVALILVMIFAPYGLAGLFQRLFRIRPAMILKKLSTAYGSSIEALRRARASPGQTGAGPEGRASEDEPDAKG